MSHQFHPNRNLNRRALLERLGFAAAIAWLGGNATATDTPARSIVDVHHHHYPPTFVSELARADQTLTAAKEWSPSRSLEDMDAAGVALSRLEEAKSELQSL